MTCRQVLNLIDAVPARDWRAPQRAEVERHTAACDACRHAWSVSSTLEEGLTRLPHVGPPDTLAATTMARIARLGDERSARPARPHSGTAVPWIWVGLGQLAGLCALVLLGVAAGAVPDVTSPRLSGGFRGVTSLPTGWPYALALATGLTLYLAGLMAPMYSRGAKGTKGTGVRKV